MKLSKKEYRAVNKNFLRDKASQTNVHTLDKGVLYEDIEEGNGDKCPQLNDVVSVHYNGTLIDGTEFDRSEEHTSELQSRDSSSYAVFCMKKKKHTPAMSLPCILILFTSPHLTKYPFY